MKIQDITFAGVYIICFLLIAYIANGLTKRPLKNREDVKSLIYEGGYIDGARSGANYLCSDSLTFEDWLEGKKQDSIQAMKTYKHL